MVRSCLEVTGTNGKDEVNMRVINGGLLSSKKGVNLPDTGSLPAEPDRKGHRRCPFCSQS